MARTLENIRNIGIVAHIDAGKTTLTERLLFYTNTSHRLGEVDRGTTITDFDPEEQERGITIYSAAVSFQWRNVSVNLIDTPGHVDFTAEVERSLRVLDGAVVVFSAREGVEAQSETVWRQADKYGVPRLALINKLDREGADFFGTIGQIEKRLGAKPLVLHLPQGMGPPHVKNPFRGIVDLVEMKLLTFPPKDEALAGGEALTKVTASPIPEELADEAALYREQLVSTLFDFSDEIAELAMQEAPIPPDLMRKAIRQATIQRKVVPILAGSALDCIGVQPVLDAWAATPATDFPHYVAGTWGPRAASDLLARDGRHWHEILNRDVLARTAFFAEAPALVLNNLLPAFRPLAAEAGETIVAAGAHDDEMYFVCRGELEAIDGEGARLGVLREGEFFGEMAVLFDQPRAATVRAITPCDLLILDGDEFRRIVNDFPAVAAEFRRIAEGRRGGEG